MATNEGGTYNPIMLGTLYYGVWLVENSTEGWKDIFASTYD